MKTSHLLHLTLEEGRKTTFSACGKELSKDDVSNSVNNAVNCPDCKALWPGVLLEPNEAVSLRSDLTTIPVREDVPVRGWRILQHEGIAIHNPWPFYSWHKKLRVSPFRFLREVWLFKILAKSSLLQWIFRWKVDENNNLHKL